MVVSTRFRQVNMQPHYPRGRLGEEIGTSLNKSSHLKRELERVVKRRKQRTWMACGPPPARREMGMDVKVTS